MNRNLRRGSFVLLLGTLACRPVITVGWQELVLFIVLIAFLFGPPLYKFIRRVDEFRKHERKDK